MTTPAQSTPPQPPVDVEQHIPAQQASTYSAREAETGASDRWPLPPAYEDASRQSVEHPRMPRPKHQEQHPRQRQHRQDVVGCTLRLIFWAATGIIWVAWFFSMVATTGDAWLEEESGTFGSAGDRRVLRACYAVYEANNVFYNQVLGLDALCGHYISFTVFQFLSTITCSLAVAAVALACCRPVLAPYLSSKTLGLAGGVLMAACAMHQVISFLLAVAMRTWLDSSGGQNNKVSMGPTFYVAVVASMVAMVLSGTLMGCSKHAGDGLVYGCCCRTDGPIESDVVGGSSADTVAGSTGIALSTHRAPSIQVHTNVA